MHCSLGKYVDLTIVDSIYALCNETLRFCSCAESAKLRSRIGAEKPKLDSHAEDLVETESLAGQQSPNLGSAQTLTG